MSGSRLNGIRRGARSHARKAEVAVPTEAEEFFNAAGIGDLTKVKEL